MVFLPGRSSDHFFIKMLLKIVLVELSLALVVNGQFDPLAFNFDDSQNISESYDENGFEIWTKFKYPATNLGSSGSNDKVEEIVEEKVEEIVEEKVEEIVEEKVELIKVAETPGVVEGEVPRAPQPDLPTQAPVKSDSDIKAGRRGGGRGYLLHQHRSPKNVENATTKSPHVKFSEGENYHDEETANCSNEYCISDEEYYDMIVEHILPSKSEWVLIGLHCMVFCVGLVGNALVCIAVYRNRSMRTVTNYFIVNLAVADFMVILFCLPPTLVWDVTQTWFMGTLCCKIVLYFQTVSVAVSVLTLTFISVDRWYAICFPLKFKSTTGRAKTAIIVIWMLAICFDIPELLVLETRKFEKFHNMDLIFFTQCSATWSEGHEEMFQLARILLLYTVPLLFMSIAYCQIVRVLWRSDNIPGHSETSVMHSGNGAGKSGRIAANNSTECQLRSRRKAAKMLVAVVLMFAVCYFPVHLLNMLRMTMDIKQTEVTGSLAIVSHWLCYANSAVNPVIYNFMSGKFRKEFQRAFAGMCKKKPRQQNTRSRADSTMVCRFTTMTAGSLTTPKTEIVQMSNTTTVNDIQQCADNAPAATTSAATTSAATTSAATAPAAGEASNLNRIAKAQKRDDEDELREARCRFDLKPPVKVMSEKKQCAVLQEVVTHTP